MSLGLGNGVTRQIVLPAAFAPSALLSGVGDYGVVGNLSKLFQDTAGSATPVTADTQPVRSWAGELGSIRPWDWNSTAPFYDEATGSVSFLGTSLKLLGASGTMAAVPAGTPVTAMFYASFSVAGAAPNTGAVAFNAAISLGGPIDPLENSGTSGVMTKLDGASGYETVTHADQGTGWFLCAMVFPNDGVTPNKMYVNGPGGKTFSTLTGVSNQEIGYFDLRTVSGYAGYMRIKGWAFGALTMTEANLDNMHAWFGSNA